MTSSNPLARDLDHVLAHAPALQELQGARVFVTGGTGFFGGWLLESFVWANAQLNLNAQMTVLTRDAASFSRRAPHLASNSAIRLHEGDVRSFEFPRGAFSHVLHAATPASATLNADNPLLMLDTITEGTRRTLEFARQANVQRFLLTSSGAVYGRQPSEITHVPEDYSGAPDALDTASAYGEGKRLAELLCALYLKQHNLNTVVARCFAFVGPGLPLDVHFAIGNFIRDALRGQAINVQGDGTPHRSYLYAADLMIWLWTILLQGKAGRAYNLGAEADYSISQIAHLVASCCNPAPKVRVAREAVPGAPPQRYVPSTQRAQHELGLRQTIDLEDAVRRTLAFASGPSLSY